MESIYLKLRFIFRYKIIEMNFFIQGILESRESTIDAHIKYIEEEIEIRIESIKNNLDQLFEKFKKDLVGIKKEIIEYKNDKTFNKFFISCFY